MDINEKFQQLRQKEHELIQQAEKAGYRLVNNQLVKDERIPVVEVYIYGETEEESYGDFMVFKKTIPLTQEQLNHIKKINRIVKEELVHKLVYEILSEIEELHDFYEVLDMTRQLNVEDIDRIVEDLGEEYSQLTDGQNLYMEFFFKSDCINGYISIFDISIDDLEKQDNISKFLQKYLKWN